MCTALHITVYFDQTPIITELADAIGFNAVFLGFKRIFLLGFVKADANVPGYFMDGIFCFGNQGKTPNACWVVTAFVLKRGFDFFILFSKGFGLLIHHSTGQNIQVVFGF